MFEESDSSSPRSFFEQRRAILKMGLAGFLASATPLVMMSKASAAVNYGGTYSVALKHAHTGESFSGVYRVGNRYLPESFEKLNYVLRDFRTGDIFPMDPRVVDIISAVQAKTRTGRPLEVLSGYRSPKTNNMLRHETSGVAKNSMHLYGQAIDFRIDGFNTGRLRKVAMGMKAGGVGYYPRSDFVHVDTGKIRYW